MAIQFASASRDSDSRNSGKRIQGTAVNARPETVRIYLPKDYIGHDRSKVKAIGCLKRS